MVRFSVELPSPGTGTGTFTSLRENPLVFVTTDLTVHAVEL